MTSKENDNVFTKCLISGAEDLVALPKFQHASLVKSKSSGFVFCSRIPSADELMRHYEGYGRQDYLSPITIKRFNEVLDSFEPFRKTNKILDIGCGVGFLLAEAKKRGWEVYGTEYTSNAIEICEAKGIKMNQGKLDPAWFSPGEFDVVTSLEVIEHINNPLEEMKNISEILRSGGLFYFTTPNFNAVERYMLGEKYNVIQYPEHLSYYTPKTINYLLNKTGFRKYKLITTGISLTRINTSRGVSDEKNVSAESSDEILRNKIEKNGMLAIAKKTINSVLSFLGMGNSLKGWYIKL